MLGFLTVTYWENVKLTVLLDMEKDGSWTEFTEILGSLGLKTVKKTIRITITTKIKKIVATIHEAKFVRPDGGLCGLLIFGWIKNSLFS